MNEEYIANMRQFYTEEIDDYNCIVTVKEIAREDVIELLNEIERLRSVGK